MAGVIKKFFEKKKLDVKFKQAGGGHKLTEDTRGKQAAALAASAAPCTQKKPAEVTEERRRAAEAAMARMSHPKQGSAAHQSGANVQSMRSQIRQEMEAERLRSDAAAKYSTGPRVVDLETAPVVSGVFFHCPMLGTEVLPKAEMEARIEHFLWDQLAEEKQMTAALLIHTLNRNAEQVSQCVEILCKYLDNISQHPTEEKYRKIRCSNKVFSEKVLPLKGCVEFLEAAGFERKSLPGQDGGPNEDYLVFDEVKSHDLELLSTLKELLVNAEPIRPELARCTRTFRCTSTRPPASMTVPNDFYSMSPDEIKREQRARTEAVEQMGMLRTKQMRERDRLKELRIYRYCLIRVRFPDNSLVQATFRAVENMGDVRTWLADYLAYDWVPYTLTTSIGARLTSEKETLAELELTPASLLNFAYDAEVLKDMAGSAAAEGRVFEANAFLKLELLEVAGDL